MIKRKVVRFFSVKLRFFNKLFPNKIRAVKPPLFYYIKTTDELLA